MKKPLLTKETVLTGSLREKTEDLLNDCRRAGDTGVDYPLDEDDAFHYLLWEDDDAEPYPAGALAILPLSYDSAECIAYVRPGMRRKGYFSQILLPKAIEDFPESDLIFPVREPDPAVVSALVSTGAEPDGREYLMELKLDSSKPDSLPAPCFETESVILPKKPESLSTEPGSLNINPEALPKIFYFPTRGKSLGSCHLERTSKDSVCLYGVEIEPRFRNQGYGYKMILSLIDELTYYGISRIYLHVEADNLSAVSLYEKAGFRTTETLSFYLF